MKSVNPLLLVQLAVAAVLLWTCLCRITRTDENTFREIRWAFVFEGFAAGLLLGAPFLPLLDPHRYRWEAGTTPWPVWLVLLVAAAAVQVSTAKHWREHGCPVEFQRGGRPTGLALAAVLLVIGSLTAAPRMALAQASGEPPAVAAMVMQPGQAVRCAAAEGCVIFTHAALVATLADAIEKSCGTQRPAVMPRRQL